TANSLTNPLQKDVVLNGDVIYTSDPTRPAPFGDVITLNGGGSPQPIVQSVTASGCGPTQLTALVQDTVIMRGGSAATSVSSVQFYAYFDRNGNGLADDGESWAFAANGATTNNPIGRWTASWDSSTLPQGQYLIGVRAQDAQGNITWSYLTQAQVNSDVGATPPNYANPSTTGVVSTSSINSCGTPPPSISKIANPSTVSSGQPVQFIVTIANPTSSAITISSISDALPAGFTLVSTDGGTIGAASSSPSNGASGTLTWAYAPAVSVPAASSRTLIFTANAPVTVGSYTNIATAEAGTLGTLVSPPAEIGVGAPRLTINKAASSNAVSPGDPITYTISYANDSPVSVTGTVISDTLPIGLTFVSATNGGSYNAGTRTITWNAGNLAAGDGPFSVSYSATITTPYPDAAAIPLLNTATIDSNETVPATASERIFVDAPRPVLAIQKSASSAIVAPGGQVVFTISYANTGNAIASSVVLTDTIPSGFTFVSATSSGNHSSGTVTWNIGSLAAGATGSVQLTLQAANPYTAANPAVNYAGIRSATTPLVIDSYTVGVSQTSQACSTYYFRNLTTNVGAGADGGTQRIANTTAPTSGTAASVAFNATTTWVEALRFYQDPGTTNDVTFSGNITTDFYITKSSGPQLRINGYLYDYNPTTGATTLIGQTATPFTSTGSGTNQLYSFTVPASGTLLKGHRLMWRFESSSNNSTTFTFLFDGTASPSQARYCVTPPADLVLDKQVNNLSIQPGGTLQYTLNFANLGQTNATGAVITDTLPSGLTFQSATLNGSAATPLSISGQQYAFSVNSTGQASGVVAGGGSGTLVINATVNQPLAGGITSLTNVAALASNQTLPKSDSITTAVLRPNVIIDKQANDTLLIPGDIVTFTLTALNTGYGQATNVTISDILPANAYFSYVANSTRLNGNLVAPDPVVANTLAVNAGTLASGAAATVTFQMQVASVGVPDGVTTLSNTATVSDGQTPGSRTSDPVTLTISTNPNLRIVKSVTPAAGSVVPGDVLTYTLLVANDGSSTATDVLVTDPIPANTSYVAGSLSENAAGRTDALDADSADFEA
ncbi:MAG TPA: hypothetical protein PKA05_16560, partial [Roseiflexaceae bacterium]|nr:hypothetical protein [Roseiflexaceae bacterium]